MNPVNNVHDTLFRQTMSHKDVAADFLRNYLPAEVTRHLLLETLAVAKDTFVASDQREHYSDMLYSVRLAGGKSAFVYLLFEHKSCPDRFVALQLLRYMLEIWELHRRQHKGCTFLPPIIPIVVYHGRHRREAVRLLDLVHLPAPELNSYVPDFEQAFYDFSPESDEDIKGSILLRLALTCLRAKNNPGVERHVREIFRMLGQLSDDATSLQWLTTIAGYVFQTMDIDREVMQDIVRSTLEAGKEESIMTLAERLRNEGRVEGRVEGREQGLEEGEVLGRHAVLQRLIAKRFGLDFLDLPTQERLRSASAGQLDLWAERILDAETVEDVFRD
jgi:predicted transposase/invertase (TIGR01784 family)